jgi:hypothetical protein
MRVMRVMRVSFYSGLAASGLAHQQHGLLMPHASVDQSEEPPHAIRPRDAAEVLLMRTVAVACGCVLLCVRVCVCVCVLDHVHVHNTHAPPLGRSRRASSSTDWRLYKVSRSMWALQCFSTTSLTTLRSSSFRMRSPRSMYPSSPNCWYPCGCRSPQRKISRGVRYDFFPAKTLDRLRRSCSSFNVAIMHLQ